jgi:WD40-like Beta Propeller Repeat
MLKEWGHGIGNGARTPDGRYFVFNAYAGERLDLSALPEKTGFFHSREAEPIRLTSGPLSYRISVISRNGERIFAAGSVQRGELVYYDATARQFLPFLSGVSAYSIRFSRDGKWAVYNSYPDYAAVAEPRRWNRSTATLLPSACGQ